MQGARVIKGQFTTTADAVDRVAEAIATTARDSSAAAAKTKINSFTKETSNF